MTKKSKVDIISRDKKESWLYNDKVKEHFFNPRNVMGEGEEKKFKADGIGEVGSPVCGDMMRVWIKVDKKTSKIKECKWRTFGCVAKDHFVFSANGPRRIEKIEIGETIIDHTGKLALVQETFKDNFKGQIYNLTPVISKFNSFKVTAGHPVLAVKRVWLNKIRRQKHTQFLRIDNDELVNTKPNFILARDLEKGDYLVFNFPKKIKDDKGLIDVELKLLGFYLSEGYLMARERKSNKFGVVAFSFHKDEREYIDELKNLLSIKFNKIAQERIRENVSETYICSRNAVAFFDKYCGRGAKNKVLSQELMFLPISKQQVLLDYYFKGDGHIYKDKRKNRQDQYYMTTASENLALQLQTIVARLGFFATVSQRMTVPSLINGRKIESKKTFIIIFIKDPKKKTFAKKHRNYFLIPLQSVSKERYNNTVHNLQIYGKNKSYLVNGFAVHNCASAIASTSVMSEMVKGMKINKALKLTAKDILKELHGLPPNKIHCSVLGDQALIAAIKDYLQKNRETKKQE